jgi:hypothetical protein
LAAQRFCMYCGAERTDDQAAACASCGRSYGAAAIPPSPSLAASTASTALFANARKRPLWAVFLLTAGTLSIYFFVHLGLMWAEMKRARQDPSMNPVAHALAQLVPFYGWFRFHAHVRTLDELLESAGSSQRLSAGRATVTYIIVSLFAVLAGSEATPDWMILPAYAAYGGFAAWRQRALNGYYDLASQNTVPERVHPVEWVIMIIGGLFLILVVIGLSLPAA